MVGLEGIVEVPKEIELWVTSWLVNLLSFWPQIVHVVESTLSEVDMFLPHYQYRQTSSTNILKFHSAQ